MIVSLIPCISLVYCVYISGCSMLALVVLFGRTLVVHSRDKEMFMWWNECIMEILLQKDMGFCVL